MIGLNSTAITLSDGLSKFEASNVLLGGQGLFFFLFLACQVVFLLVLYIIIFSNLKRNSGKFKYVLPLLFLIMCDVLLFFLYRYYVIDWWNILNLTGGV